MLAAFAIAALGFWTRNILFVGPYFIFIIGVPQLSHWAFDGFHSPAITGSKGLSLFMALRLNFRALVFAHQSREGEFLAKYPFVRSVYTQRFKQETDEAACVASR